MKKRIILYRQINNRRGLETKAFPFFIHFGNRDKGEKIKKDVTSVTSVTLQSISS